eukprot:6654225-Pyramimonas_sp.AAC.1
MTNDSRHGTILPTRCGPGYILTTDQSDAGSVGIFSQRTHNKRLAARHYIAHKVQTWVYSPDGPFRRRERRYIPTTDQSQPTPGVTLSAAALLPEGRTGTTTGKLAVPPPPPRASAAQSAPPPATVTVTSHSVTVTSR